MESDIEARIKELKKLKKQDNKKNYIFAIIILLSVFAIGYYLTNNPNPIPSNSSVDSNGNLNIESNNIADLTYDAGTTYFYVSSKESLVKSYLNREFKSNEQFLSSSSYEPSLAPSNPYNVYRILVNSDADTIDWVLAPNEEYIYTDNYIEYKQNEQQFTDSSTVKPRLTTTTENINSSILQSSENYANHESVIVSNESITWTKEPSYYSFGVSNIKWSPDIQVSGSMSNNAEIPINIQVDYIILNGDTKRECEFSSNVDYVSTNGRSTICDDIIIEPMNPNEPKTIRAYYYAIISYYDYNKLVSGDSKIEVNTFIP